MGHLSLSLSHTHTFYFLICIEHCIGCRLGLINSAIFQVIAFVGNLSGHIEPIRAPASDSEIETLLVMKYVRSTDTSTFMDCV